MRTRIAAAGREFTHAVRGGAPLPSEPPRLAPRRCRAKIAGLTSVHSVRCVVLTPIEAALGDQEGFVMKSSLRAGLRHELSYRVATDKTVPHVFPDSELFRTMPQVFATSYLVGLVEWACMEVLAPHLDGGEQSVGTGIQLSHVAATPPGLAVQIDVVLEEVNDRRVRFRVKARDEIEPIGEGVHERFIIERARFMRRVGEKASPLSSPR